MSAPVESMVANLIASRLPSEVPLEIAGLHDGGVEVKIMRHDRRAENADADVKHVVIFSGDRRRGTNPRQHARSGSASTKRALRREAGAEWCRSARRRAPRYNGTLYFAG